MNNKTNTPRLLWHLSMMVFILAISSACTSSSTWQGTYYPRGCLDCDDQQYFSPVFKSYKECKSWASGKIKLSQDKATCGKNCSFEGKLDMSKCDVVVRSWKIPFLPDSPTFESFMN